MDSALDSELDSALDSGFDSDSALELPDVLDDADEELLVLWEELLPELPEAEKIAFCKTLDTIYRRSKQESRAGFPHITALTEQGEGERHE